MVNLVNFACRYCDKKWKMVPRLELPVGAQMEGICPSCFEEYQMQTGRFATTQEKLLPRQTQSKPPQ